MRAIMMENPQKFLEVALGAVKKVEPIFVKHFGKAAGVMMKVGKTPSLVSDADKEIEKLLTKEISTRFPAHAIVGEEFGSNTNYEQDTKVRTAPSLPFSPSKEGERKKLDSCFRRNDRKGSGNDRGEAKSMHMHTWYIDPIDGTTNYIHGLAHCAISVGLWDATGPLVSVVSDPINRACYTAVRGGGAYKNGKKIRVSSRGALKDCLGAIGWRWNEPETGMDLLRRLTPRAYRLRVLSSSVSELCLVAEGALDFYVGTNCAIWDVAAGLLVLTEAGGSAGDWEGKPLAAHPSSLAASNGRIHQELLDVLRE